VTLPPELKDQLAEPVERLVKRAKTVYSGEKFVFGPSGGPTSVGGSFRGGGPVRNSGAEKKSSRENKPIALKSAFEQAANDAGELKALKKIIRALIKRFPELANEFGF